MASLEGLDISTALLLGWLPLFKGQHFLPAPACAELEGFHILFIFVAEAAASPQHKSQDKFPRPLLEAARQAISRHLIDYRAGHVLQPLRYDLCHAAVQSLNELFAKFTARSLDDRVNQLFDLTIDRLSVSDHSVCKYFTPVVAAFKSRGDVLRSVQDAFGLRRDMPDISKAPWTDPSKPPVQSQQLRAPSRAPSKPTLFRPPTPPPTSVLATAPMSPPPAIPQAQCASGVGEPQGSFPAPLLLDADTATVSAAPAATVAPAPPAATVAPAPPAATVAPAPPAATVALAPPVATVAPAPPAATVAPAAAAALPADAPPWALSLMSHNASMHATIQAQAAQIADQNALIASRNAVASHNASANANQNANQNASPNTSRGRDRSKRPRQLVDTESDHLPEVSDDEESGTAVVVDDEDVSSESEESPKRRKPTGKGNGKSNGKGKGKGKR